MSHSTTYVRGRFTEVLARWSEELAAGRSWAEVQSEILMSCQGRVDLLRQLLREAETGNRITWPSDPGTCPWGTDQTDQVRVMPPGESQRSPRTADTSLAITGTVGALTL